MIHIMIGSFVLDDSGSVSIVLIDVIASAVVDDLAQVERLPGCLSSCRCVVLLLVLVMVFGVGISGPLPLMMIVKLTQLHCSTCVSSLLSHSCEDTHI